MKVRYPQAPTTPATTVSVALTVNSTFSLFAELNRVCWWPPGVPKCGREVAVRGRAEAP
jgi:hypothetical protein